MKHAEENNMGNMDAGQARTFFNKVAIDLGLGDFGFDITPATPSICLGDRVLICENDLNYPWFTKQAILHEITHHLVPEDTIHGTSFHKMYAGLVSRFLAGGTGKPPDRREKIAGKACVVCELYNFGTQNCNRLDDIFCALVLEVANQIIALMEE